MNSFRSEYLKFIYNKWLLLTVLATIILVPLFVIFLHETPSYITENYVLTQILESFYLGQAGIIIITILFIGQEFNGSTLRSSLLANPTRWKFFFIKLIVILSISIFLRFINSLTYLYLCIKNNNGINWFNINMF